MNTSGKVPKKNKSLAEVFMKKLQLIESSEKHSCYKAFNYILFGRMRFYFNRIRLYQGY